MNFSDLKLIPPLVQAVEKEGYTHPTPIQERAIPHVLAGRDLLGCAQTGTGKTAAFALPILQHLVVTPRGPNPPGSGRRPIRVLVLSPTRELAAQIGDSFATYGSQIPFFKVQGQPLKPVRHTVIFGGVGQRPQEEALRAGVDIVVATPGRFLDLSQQGFIQLDRLEIFVLDEADRMLDMGFIHDVRKVIALLPDKRQTLFFSATMPPEIQELANRILRDPERVEVTPPATTVERIAQSVYFVEKDDKRGLLEHMLADRAVTRALVFTRTKHGANRVAEKLERAGVVAAAIHGNKSQGARERALKGFKEGTCRVLVATDIASRGIDVDGVSHVINFELPNVPEDYVHRIGRTARAGASGVAVSFCDLEEREYLADIERVTRQTIPVIEDHPFRSPHPKGARSTLPPPSSRTRGRGHDGGRGGRGHGHEGRERGHRPGGRWDGGHHGGGASAGGSQGGGAQGASQGGGQGRAGAGGPSRPGGAPPAGGLGFGRPSGRSFRPRAR